MALLIYTANDLVKTCVNTSNTITSITNGKDADYLVIDENIKHYAKSYCITEIVDKCLSGKMEFFEELFKQMYNKAYGAAYNICGSKSIAEDIVQEGFIICYRSLKNLKSSEAFNTWFYRIIVRLSWRMVKRQKVNGSIEEFNKSLVSADITNVICSNLVIRQKINNLPLKLKTVLILFYFNDLTISEISKVLGCFEGTVKSRLYKARKILQKELASLNEESTDNYLVNLKEVN